MKPTMTVYPSGWVCAGEPVSFNRLGELTTLNICVDRLTESDLCLYDAEDAHSLGNLFEELDKMG